ncbi:uncharacterized protein LOC112572764 isoform X1 [Pomacea canaliculata]|uniref:uncharacterized protein LOC112572764 isoform X1 n=2 Tax=Pomacea canaliculata TaxID=400727 RepID=UPI000D73F052|nr:uncharacterized protein LOC112572764 isoform X1 [Pomacea canaliculata]XP_025108415.1 uncharacterized protein LOC112572764 isoform X1 [Pomacea canaliculata]
MIIPRMPQAWNPANRAGWGAGGTSRHMKVVNSSLESLHRIRVRNSLEAKLCSQKRSFVERDTAISNYRMQQARRTIIERQKRLVVYKLVIQKHPIKQRADYQAALNDDYSLHGLRHELRSMRDDIDPRTVRKRRIDKMVKTSYNRYMETVLRNREVIYSMFPVKEQRDVETKDEPTASNEGQQITDKEQGQGWTNSQFVAVSSGVSEPRQPLRGLAREAQEVTLHMMKENAWLKKADSLSRDCLTSSKEMNPRPVLPPINP